MSAGEEEDVRTRIALARLETKLDVVIGQHGEQLRDHEARIRVVEDRKTISPAGLTAALASVIAIGTGVVTLSDPLFK